MIGKNISFIVGQHHSELDKAVWHHRGRNGFVLDVATIHESIGQEVIGMWFDRTSFLETLSGCETIDLRVRCGLALTQAGPIAFILWWLPPVDEEGFPYFLKEHLLSPMHEGTREVLRRLGGQKCLHVALIGSGPRLLGLHEFKHDYGFFDLYSYAQAAAEKGWPGYNFDIAHAAFEEAFIQRWRPAARPLSRTHLAGRRCPLIRSPTSALFGVSSFLQRVGEQTRAAASWLRGNCGASRIESISGRSAISVSR